MRLMEEKGQTYLDDSFHIFARRHIENLKSTSFTCSHPDQGYIQDYFREKRMNKMPGFLGYGARYSEAVPIKTAPAWCPEKRAAKQKRNGQ